MQFSIITTLTLALAASTMALPTQQGAASDALDRRQSGSRGLGQACNSASDCIGSLNCIFGGGQSICSRNRGLGQPCAQNADCNSFNCGAGSNGNQGAVLFECLA
jgi:hypothetical protein